MGNHLRQASACSHVSYRCSSVGTAPRIALLHWPEGIRWHSRRAYVWAFQKTSPSYEPTSAHRFSSARSPSTVTRLGVGNYSIKFPGLPPGGAAVVSPTGPGKSVCSVSSIRTSGSPLKVGVRCFGLSGAALDTAFMLAGER